ncbi:unnamed protein product, partial [Porites lobata]
MEACLCDIRSSMINDKLMINDSKTETFPTLGDRAFVATAPKLWNNLPLDLRRTSDFEVFQLFVFCIHRDKLKRTSFLLINLAVADMLVGLTEIAMVGAIGLPQMTGLRKIGNTDSPDISTVFQAAFSTASVLFLALISLERAFALLWPLRHRVTSTSTYIYSIILVWIAASTVVSLSYLAIRTRLTQQVPAIDNAHNRQDNERNKKLSRTLFIVI